MNCNAAVTSLLNYAEEKGMIKACDKHYFANLIIAEIGAGEYDVDESGAGASLPEILSAICDVAYENGKLEANSVVYRDLFDTKIMGFLLPAPLR